MPKTKRQSILYWSLMAALLVVCAALAALQYRWIDQVSVAARERLQAELQSNLRSLSRDFNSQISAAAERLIPLGRVPDPSSAEAEVSSRFLALKSGRALMFHAVLLAEP